MSVGTSTATLTATRSKKSMYFSGDPIWRRKAVTVTVAGYAPTDTSNLVLSLFRDSTLVAQCTSFTAGAGAVDLDTAELEDAMSDFAMGEICVLSARLWDKSTLELLAEGTCDVRQNTRTYAGDTGSTVAIPVPYGATWENYQGTWCFVFRAPDGTVVGTMALP